MLPASECCVALSAVREECRCPIMMHQCEVDIHELSVLILLTGQHGVTLLSSIEGKLDTKADGSCRWCLPLL